MIFSIIIPTLNRDSILQQTLESLSQVDFDRTLFEIIIVDNGSTDETEKIAGNFIKGNRRLNISYLYDATPGLLTGRHRGALAAKGEILSFIDDDVKIGSNWLSSLNDVFTRRNDIYLAGGKCLPEYEINPPAWLEKRWITDSIQNVSMLCDLSLCDYGEHEREIEATWIFGLNFSIRSNCFFELKGFHPDSMPKHLQYLQGDGETGLSYKLRDKGYKTMYHPDALVLHQVPASRLQLKYFEERSFFEGVSRSFTQLRIKRPEPETMSMIQKIKHGMTRTIQGIVQHRHKSSTSIQYSKDVVDWGDEQLKLRLEIFENAGFNYHQRIACEMPDLMNWIKKVDYLDYSLPKNLLTSA